MYSTNIFDWRGKKGGKGKGSSASAVSRAHCVVNNCSRIVLQGVGFQKQGLLKDPGLETLFTLVHTPNPRE